MRNPLDYPAEKVGRTKRDVSALVLINRGKGVRKEACTVPKGTEVRQIGGQWFVADLSWLEACEGRKIEAAGHRAGLGRTSSTYHGAIENGIEVDAKDVTGIKAVAGPTKPATAAGRS